MSFGKITARQIWCKSSGYIDTDRFIIHIKTEDFPNYVKDEEKRFKTFKTFAKNFFLQKLFYSIFSIH